MGSRLVVAVWCGDRRWGSGGRILMGRLGFWDGGVDMLKREREMRGENDGCVCLCAN